MKELSSEAAPKIFVLLLREDDPRKCTAAKLVKLRLATPLFRVRQVPRRAIVLNPFAPQVLLPGDSTLALKSGIVAIDCSWEKAERAFGIRMPGEPRRLPPVLASNPVNYAKLHKLSSAEALAASLYIMKFKKAAIQLLATFKWGEGFFSLNSEVLESYCAALTEDDLIHAEAEFF